MNISLCQETMVLAFCPAHISKPCVFPSSRIVVLLLLQKLHALISMHLCHPPTANCYASFFSLLLLSLTEFPECSNWITKLKHGAIFSHTVNNLSKDKGAGEVEEEEEKKVCACVPPH